MMRQRQCETDIPLTCVSRGVANSDIIKQEPELALAHLGYFMNQAKDIPLPPPTPTLPCKKALLSPCSGNCYGTN